MNKFKVGDVVQRKSHTNDITKYLGCGNNGTYTVTDVNSNGSWIQLDGWDDPGKDHYPWYSNNFVLVESDELPPAPESVQYNEENSALGTFGHLLVQPSIEGPLLYIEVYSECCSTGRSTGAGIRIEPDAALQLCHDLRRMAMSIKKKGKQDAAK